jgi:hypothetical protein
MADVRPASPAVSAEDQRLVFELLKGNLCLEVSAIAMIDLDDCIRDSHAGPVPPRQSWGHRSVFMSLAQQLFLQAQVRSLQSKRLPSPSLIIFSSRPVPGLSKQGQMLRNSHVTSHLYHEIATRHATSLKTKKDARVGMPTDPACGRWENAAAESKQAASQIGGWFDLAGFLLAPGGSSRRRRMRLSLGAGSYVYFSLRLFMHDRLSPLPLPHY